VCHINDIVIVMGIIIHVRFLNVGDEIVVSSIIGETFVLVAEQSFCRLLSRFATTISLFAE